MSPQRTQKDEALDVLRKVYPKGSTVYTILRSVSRSGATRKVTVMGLEGGRDDNGFNPVSVYFPHYAVSVLCGLPQGSWDMHDVVILNDWMTPDTIAEHIAVALYGDRNALNHRSV